MPQVYRQDRVQVTKADSVDPLTGFWRGEAVIARVGVYEYSDGQTTWREFVPPETLQDEAWLASMHLAPVTLGHPPELVTADNVQRYGKGVLDKIEWEDEGLLNEAMILIQAADAVGAVTKGMREVSCGYLAQVVDQPGVWLDPYGNEHPYDKVQTARHGNHLALVDRGRQGETVAIRGDGAACMVETMADKELQQRLDAALAAATAAEAAAKEADGKIAALQARLDEATAQAATAKADAEAAAKTAYAEGVARAELVATAKTVCGDTYTADGKSARQIRVDMLAAMGVTVADDRSDDYVVARVDAAIEARKSDTAAAVGRLLSSGGQPHNDAADFLAEAKARNLIAG